MSLTSLARAAAVASTGLSTLQTASPDRSHQESSTYRVALFGDVPYNAAGRADYPRLLADINTSDIAFSVFDGDLKAGGD